eukprot:g10373.t1
MRCDGDPEALARRRAVASLLIFAKELEKAGRISKASKGLLKELIVHENLEVMSVGEALARAEGGQQQGRSLQILDEQIKKRASKSHQELFEICPLEQAHLLSQQDTATLAEGSDTKSLVYGEIDFWSFYDVIKVAADGLDTGIAHYRNQRQHGSFRDEDRDEDEEEEEEEEEVGQNVLEGGEARLYRGSLFRTGNDRDAPISLDRGRIGGRGGATRRRLWKRGAGSTAVLTPDGVRVSGRGEESVRGRGRGDRRAQEGLKFVDLGSGNGKAVFAAVLAVDFRCAVGIEILAGVHRASTRILKRYRRLVEPVLCSPAVIKLQHGSFLDPGCDWSDADLVFANSTCFAEETLLAVAERAKLLHPGARVVTFTTALKTPWLRVLMKRRYHMSWGPATVFIHQKLSPSEYARRLTETTPFDEDQGISRATGGGDGGGGGGNKPGEEESSPAPPIVFAPVWSLPWEGSADGDDSITGDVDGGEEEGREDEDDDDDDDGGGSGFGVSGGDDDDYDEALREAGNRSDTSGEEQQGDTSGEGTMAARPACCLSSPRRPLHC